MANPVAIYVPEPAAPRRGGLNTAQIIQIDPYRSSGRARYGYSRDAHAADQTQGTAGDATVRRFARYAERFTADTQREFKASDDELFEAGRRRAPAGIAFAAQQIAQEGLAPGLHFENYSPALAAYATAAQSGMPNAPRNGQLLELSV